MLTDMTGISENDNENVHWLNELEWSILHNKYISKRIKKDDCYFVRLLRNINSVPSFVSILYSSINKYIDWRPKNDQCGINCKISHGFIQMVDMFL